MSAGALIAAKAVLGGISGGLKGYSDALENDSNKVEANKTVTIPAFKFESKKEEPKEEVPVEKKETSDTDKINPTNPDSDSRLKEIYPDIPDSILQNFATLDPIVFKYNGKGQQLGNDDREHYGVTAQDLQANPLTESTVSEDDNGYLNVDGGQLSLANTATISELSRRILALEEVVKRNGLV